ncbi:Coatomer subunit beta' [Aphelenchoides bicaudatus]|nr:Coatomer subunit beta' [Aphelenchoides bicaudatus]
MPKTPITIHFRKIYLPEEDPQANATHTAKSNSTRFSSVAWSMRDKGFMPDMSKYSCWYNENCLAVRSGNKETLEDYGLENGSVVEIRDSANVNHGRTIAFGTNRNVSVEQSPVITVNFRKIYLPEEDPQANATHTAKSNSTRFSSVAWSMRDKGFMPDMSKYSCWYNENCLAVRSGNKETLEDYGLENGSVVEIRDSANVNHGRTIAFGTNRNVSVEQSPVITVNFRKIYLPEEDPQANASFTGQSNLGFCQVAQKLKQDGFLPDDMSEFSCWHNGNCLAVGSSSGKSLEDYGLENGSVVEIRDSANVNHGRTIAHGTNRNVPLEFTTFDEIKHLLKPTANCINTSQQVYVNYIITELNIERETNTKELFKKVHHSGISMRRADVLDRMKQNSKGFSHDKFGMLILFEWTNESSKDFGFSSPEEAAVVFEYIISSFEALFARSQLPGVQGRTFNRQCYTKAEKLTTDSNIMRTIFNRILHVLTNPAFVEAQDKNDEQLTEINARIRKEANQAVSLMLKGPAVAMDTSGKIRWANYSEMQLVNLRTIDVNVLAEARDGERLALTVENMGACEIYPQTLQYSSDGRYVVACGDGRYIVYQNIAELHKKAQGIGLEFVWSKDPNIYAIRTSSSLVRILKDFKKAHAIRPDIVVDGIDGGVLLAVRSAGSLCFYEWETAQLIRRIEISAKHIFWSEDGNLVTIAGEESFRVLKYNAAAFENANPEDITENGIEDSFEVIGEHTENVKTGVWIGDCFIFTTGLNCLSYSVGREIVSIAHLDRPIYLLGYMEKDNRIYACDGDHNIVSYKILRTVLQYQVATLKNDLVLAGECLERAKDYKLDVNFEPPSKKRKN